MYASCCARFAPCLILTLRLLIGVCFTHITVYRNTWLYFHLKRSCGFINLFAYSLLVIITVWFYVFDECDEVRMCDQLCEYGCSNTLSCLYWKGNKVLKLELDLFQSKVKVKVKSTLLRHCVLNNNFTFCCRVNKD